MNSEKFITTCKNMSFDYAKKHFSQSAIFNEDNFHVLFFSHSYDSYSALVLYDDKIYLIGYHDEAIEFNYLNPTDSFIKYDVDNV